MKLLTYLLGGNEVTSRSHYLPGVKGALRAPSKGSGGSGDAVHPHSPPQTKYFITIIIKVDL